jgi:2-succinyl-5-enolpyruvyl-6-hydroxy-3-cyclohexene-1-carboxylate synthase
MKQPIEPVVAAPPAGSWNLACAHALVAATCPTGGALEAAPDRAGVPPAAPALAGTSPAAAALPRQVVLSPGARNSPLAVAFGSSSAVALTVVLDERQAAFFALGLARRSGRAVLLLCTSGSAMAHYHPAVLEAFYGRVPLLLLSADRPAELQNCRAPQTIEQAHFFGRHVVHSASLGAPQSAADLGAWRTAAGLALDAATAALGPAHLNLAFREPLLPPASHQPAAARAGADAPGLRRVVRGPAPADLAYAAELAARCRSVERGLMVCGPRAVLDAAAVDLAARLGWPVLAEPAAWPVAAVPAATAIGWIRHADGLLRGAPASTPPPQLVLRLGDWPTSKALGRWLGQSPSPQTVLLADAPVYADPTHCLQELWIGDPSLLCGALATALVGPPSAAARAYAERWRQADAAAAAATAAFCRDHFFGGSLARQLVAALEPGSTLVVGNSLAIRDVDAFAAPAMGVHVCCSRGVNGIDGSLSTLLGTARAAPAGSAVVGLMGDLTFLHDVGALQLARQLQQDALAVVVNNAGGQIFAQLQLPLPAATVDRLFCTPQRADLAALCAGAAVPYFRATGAEDFAHVLNQALARRHGAGLVVIEAIVPPAAGGSHPVYADAFAAMGQGDFL